MNNIVLAKMRNDKKNTERLQKAAKVLKNGGLVVMPSDTGYVIAINVLENKAAERLFDITGRDAKNPLTVYISDSSAFVNVPLFIPPEANVLVEKFWPGLLTLVLPKMDIISDFVSGGLQTVRIRMPQDDVAREFLGLVDFPVAAASVLPCGLNTSFSSDRIIEKYGESIAAIIDDGDRTAVGIPTILSLCSQVPKVIRPGNITMAEISSKIGTVELDRSILSKIKRSALTIIPGLTQNSGESTPELILTKGRREAFISKVNDDSDNVGALCFDEESHRIFKPHVTYGRESQTEMLAYRVTDALYEVNSLGVDKVYIHGSSQSTDGIGVIVYSRLLRAAGFRVLEL